MTGFALWQDDSVDALGGHRQGSHDRPAPCRKPLICLKKLLR